MGDVGIPELVLILFIIVLLFGPSKIPEIARSLGTAIKEFKKALKEGEEERSGGSGQNQMRGDQPRDDSTVDSKANSEVS